MKHYLNPQVAMGLEGNYGVRLIYRAMLEEIKLDNAGKCVGIGPALVNDLTLSRHLILVKKFVNLDEAPVLLITDKQFVYGGNRQDMKIDSIKHKDPKYLYISLAKDARYYDGEHWILGMYVYLGPVGRSALETPFNKTDESVILWISYIYDSMEYAAEDSENMGHGCLLLYIDDGKTISQMVKLEPNHGACDTVLVEGLACLAYSAIVHEDRSTDGSIVIVDLDCA